MQEGSGGQTQCSQPNRYLLEELTPVGKAGSGTTTPLPACPARFYGRVELDAQRVHKDMALIVEEVIDRLNGQVGCEVAITLEIRAKLQEGLDEGTVRTTSENSRTLKFEQYGFEE